MSTNISKQKREDLLNKIKEIRNYIATAPKDENTGNLLSYLSDLEKDVNGKKYGLVFEEHREEIDEVLDTHTPVLTEEKDLFINNGGQMNFLIEGDNLASLQLLEKTHRGKIDAIYIDPPYNTGNKDFIYDDAFIDTNDTFRHSKWLSFMQKRLIIARNLLSDSGVILISIDDNEYSDLKMLCDDVFGVDNNLGVFIVKSTPNARDYGFVGKMHEYMLFYGKKASAVTTNLMPIENKKFKYEDNIGGFNIHPLYNSNEAFTNINRPNLFYPFYLNPSSREGDFYKISLTKDCDNYIEIYPPKSVKNGVQFVWRWGKEKAQENINKEIIGYKVGEEYRIVQKMRHYEKLIRSILDSTEYTTRKGTAEIEQILGGKVFSFPKPLSLIKDMFYMATQKNYTILDFFAGSGTTGHAVMKLNAEDGGNRKFIICTNNENNICRDVTYERIKRVIDKENYEASLKYYKVDYIPISDRMYYEYADELLKHIRELVELENGVNFAENAEIGIVLTEEELDEFIANTDAFAKCRKLYMGHDLLPSEEQERMLKKYGIEISVIPDYYYRDLQEG